MIQEVSPQIIAYADDSITDECIAVAAVVVDADKISRAEELLRAAKGGLGVSEDEPLHCRVMFSGDARKGTPWDAASPEAIDAVVVDLCKGLKALCRKPIVCRINPKAIPAQASALGALFEGFEGKGWASFAYTGVFGALRDQAGANTRVYMDPDKTKTQWLSGKRAQAERTREPFLSINLAPGEEPKKYVPIVERAPKPPLLEVADLYAWTAARATSASGGRRTAWSRDLMKLVEPENLIFQLDNQQSWNKDVGWSST